MKKKKIVLIGSSMSMPRKWDNIPIENTYPFMLQEYFQDSCFFYNRSRRSNTTYYQSLSLNIHDDISSIDPDLILMHIGISDCAPRLFTYTESKILNLLPINVRNRIIQFFSKRRLFFTRVFKKVYVKPDIFENSCDTILNSARQLEKKMIIIGIAPTHLNNLSRSYSFQENIDLYNQILKQKTKEHNFNFVDLKSIVLPDSHLLNDGFHLTREGNKAIFDNLLPIVIKVLREL